MAIDRFFLCKKIIDKISPSIILNHMVKYGDDILGQTFYALSDDTRRKMLHRLSLKAKLSILELAKPFDISLPAVSKHIKILEKAGLVTRNKVGRTHEISINPAPMVDAFAWLHYYHEFWEKRLTALEQYVDNEKR